MDEKIVVGRGIVRGDSIRSYIGDRGHVLIVDKVVHSRYSSMFDGLHVIEVSAGEGVKTLDLYADIVKQMTKRNLTRRDVVVAVGGGTVTDLAGFVASTYKRGIGLINIPTTLLGMCDAAIGGKNALNISGVKNVIGTFYHPELVIIDPTFIETLRYSTLLDGLGELFKYAVGFDRTMLKLLERLAPILEKRASFQGAWDSESQESMLTLVKLAASIKQAIVRSDFEESHLRKTLNLGHTLAHAIESESEYRISHGVAVAIGTLMIVAWAHRKGVMRSDEFVEVQECYRALGFPKLRNLALDWDRALARIGTDKKMVDHVEIDAVVLHGLGEARVQRIAVTEFSAEMMKSLSELLSHEIAREVSPLSLDVKEYLADFKSLLDQRAQPQSRRVCIDVPGSKSYAHRYLILAGYANAPTEIRGVTLSDDVQATISAVRTMADVEIEIRGEECKTILVTPKTSEVSVPNHIVVNCRESASTARFLIPFSGLAQMRMGRERDAVSTYFRGAGSLQRRPMNEILQVLRAQGILEAESDKLPFTVKGWIWPGFFRLSGGISSQFLSGLLMATPLLGEPSVIEITGRQVSQPYVNMTLKAMEDMGAKVEKELRGDEGAVYRIVPGSYASEKGFVDVEKDFSQAAFWLVAEMLRREYEIKGIRTGLPELYVPGLNLDSLQSDRMILDVLGIALGEDGRVLSVAEPMTTVDLSDAPDLLPILTTYYAVSGRVGKVVGAGRNRIKESDRINSIASELNRLGYKVTETADGVEVWPSGLQSGERNVQSHGDHRIAMSLGIASLFVSDVVIEGKEAIQKSYPSFFDQLRHLKPKDEEEFQIADKN